MAEKVHLSEDLMITSTAIYYKLFKDDILHCIKLL